MDYIMEHPDSSFRSGQDRKVLYMDAVSQFKAEHRKIQRLFLRLEQKHKPITLTAMVQAICDRLSIYLILKEEVFYPSLRRAANSPSQKSQLDESVIEHFSLKTLMETLDGQAPGDPMFTAKVETLKRHFLRHVEDEERWLYPKIRALPMSDLGQRLQERRKQLVREGFR